ncbi:MAG: MalY/PatB family protein [Syntrophobacteraceae bacterium]
MKYNFDTPIDRHNSTSFKWNGAHLFLGEKAMNALPLWVADMDFRVPREVIETLKQTADHGIFGYSIIPDSYYDSIISWMNKQYKWSIKREWIYHSPGIVTGLNCIVNAFTNEGDAIAIQPPVYYPFTNCIVNNNLRVVNNCLTLSNNLYTIDYDDLEKCLAIDNVKMLILCNPHNPVGRVWTRDELTILGHICLKYNIIVVSDEIHADLTFGDFSTTAFANISDDFARNTIICTSASKTFNLAGLQTANIIIPNNELGNIFYKYMTRLNLLRPNIFGQVATQSAYNFGEEWLLQVKNYLQDNLNFLLHYINQNITGINVIKPEGTYLVWLDCRELGMGGEELKMFMLDRAGVAFDDGYLFGPGGEGFTRMNIACTRQTLHEALRRIAQALKEKKA